VEQRPLSPLEAELAARLRQHPRPLGSLPQRPGRASYQAAQRRVRERLGRPDEASVALPGEGRWTLVHRFGVLGKPPAPAEQAAALARQLLARHGVVTYESLANEAGAWSWAAIYPELQRLEMRGEVRRGYFVRGLPGVQFALPEVVERLRAPANPPAGEGDALVVMNACDPANLYGPAMAEGPVNAAGEPLTFARIPSTWLVLSRGLPALLIEETGAQLSLGQGVDEVLAAQAVRAWLQHLASFEHRTTVASWNGTPVLGSPGQVLLEAAGFYRDYPGMTWER
jgi:ATP-dependent Lhr-like helicase